MPRISHVQPAPLCASPGGRRAERPPSLRSPHYEHIGLNNWYSGGYQPTWGRARARLNSHCLIVCTRRSPATCEEGRAGPCRGSAGPGLDARSGGLVASLAAPRTIPGLSQLRSGEPRPAGMQSDRTGRRPGKLRRQISGQRTAVRSEKGCRKFQWNQNARPVSSPCGKLANSFTIHAYEQSTNAATMDA